MPMLVNLPAFAIVMLITWLLLRGARESATRQQRDGGRQAARRWALFIARRARQHQPGELQAVRAERLHRHPSGRGDRVLRLHRLRRHLDRGRGDAEPAAQPADRHPRRAGDLHRHLRRRRRRAHRHGAVSAAGGGRPAGPGARDRRATRRVGWIVALGAAVSMAAVLLVFQYGQPRIFFAMARDGLLPQWAARLNAQYPHAVGHHARHRSCSWRWRRCSATRPRPTTSPTSAPCSRSRWCASACSCCASTSPTVSGRSGCRWCGWWRRSAPPRASSSWWDCRCRRGSGSAAGCWPAWRVYVAYGYRHSKLRSAS